MKTWLIALVLTAMLVRGAAGRVPQGTTQGSSPHRTSTIVALNVDGLIEYVAPSQKGFKVGDHEKFRIVYNEAAVDPKTHTVRLLNMQHFMDGHYTPPRPDSKFMPMTDAWLDLSSQPYRYHFKASVFHGRPILIVIDENARTISVEAADQPNNPVLLRDRYTIDPIPVRGKEVIEAGTPVHPIRGKPTQAGAASNGPSEK